MPGHESAVFLYCSCIAVASSCVLTNTLAVESVTAPIITSWLGGTCDEENESLLMLADEVDNEENEVEELEEGAIEKDEKTGLSSVDNELAERT